jgi:hypothetical protein
MFREIKVAKGENSSRGTNLNDAEAMTANRRLEAGPARAIMAVSLLGFFKLNGS